MAQPKHGLPDWGVTAGAATVYQLNDLGEAVVRLGSPVSYDRRGDVFSIDSFENGLHGWVFGGSPSGRGRLSLVEARSGLFSIKLDTVSWAADSTAVMQRWGALPSISGTGFEFSIGVYPMVGRFEGWLYVYGTLARYKAAFRWDYVGDTLYVRDEGGDWVSVATGVDLMPSEDVFNVAKLVVDPETGYYTRLRFNDAVYDLSAIQMESLGAGTMLTHLVLIQLINTRADLCFAFVDDVILTQNEP